MFNQGKVKAPDAADKVINTSPFAYDPGPKITAGQIREYNMDILFLQKGVKKEQSSQDRTLQQKETNFICLYIPLIVGVYVTAFLYHKGYLILLLQGFGKQYALFFRSSRIQSRYQYANPLYVQQSLFCGKLMRYHSVIQCEGCIDHFPDIKIIHYPLLAFSAHFTGIFRIINQEYDFIYKIIQ